MSEVIETVTEDTEVIDSAQTVESPSDNEYEPTSLAVLIGEKKKMANEGQTTGQQYNNQPPNPIPQPQPQGGAEIPETGIVAQMAARAGASMLEGMSFAVGAATIVYVATKLIGPITIQVPMAQPAAVDAHTYE